MGPISLKHEIDAPREAVFELICDLSRRPSFTDHFATGFRLAREDAHGLGAAARMKVGAPGGIDFLKTEITEADRPQRVIERGGGGRWDRVPTTLAWELVPSAGDMTTVTLTFWTEPAKPIDRVRDLGAARWWRRRWSRALKRLAAEAESGSEGDRPVSVGGSDLPPLATR